MVRLIIAGQLICLAGWARGELRADDAAQAAHSPNSPDVVDSPKPSLPQVRRWIAELASDDFAEREAATQNLESAGAIAVAPLYDAVSSDDLEVTCRAVRALTGLARRGDSLTFEKAQEALERLSESKIRPAAWRAQISLSALSDVRRRHALSRIAELGGIVKKPQPVVGQNALLAPDDPRPQTVIVVLTRNWRGGDEGLVHLRRLGETERLIPALRDPVYYTRSAPISPAAIAELMQSSPGLKIEERGPMLGVSGVEQFGQQPGVVVSSVVEGSAADMAGIKPNDMILTYDGDETTNLSQVVEITKRHEAGDKVLLEVFRNNEIIRIEATLGDWR